jgi:hypothetical protein
MRITLIAALITLIGCGQPGSGGSGGGTSGDGGGTSGTGGSSGTGGGTASSGGGTASSGGGTASSGGGTASSGGGTASSGGGTASSGGGTASSGGGTASSGGGTASSGGGTASSGGGTAGTGGGTSSGGPTIKKVFVIALENQGTAAVYQNSDAPYLNALMGDAGYATSYGDVLAASVPSEPHYVWLEAGTNAFSDHTFTTDSDPSSSNSTASTAHLITQMAALSTPKTWRSYQEDLDTSSNGACPIATGDGFTNFYAAKHDPFVFFHDVSGSPPSKTNTFCASHHKAYTTQTLAADLNANDVADYTFITPNLCNDMHGGICTNGCIGVSGCVQAGDAWLQTNVPPIIDYVNAHEGILILVWDEPETSGSQPFIIIGPHQKKGHVSSVMYSHSSYVKSLQEIFGVTVSSNVSSANDFADFFQAGYFP